jgi:hypothetical protein
MIYVQNLLKIWLNKKGKAPLRQQRLGVGLLRCALVTGLLLRCDKRLRMFSVPIDGLANVFCELF